MSLSNLFVHPHKSGLIIRSMLRPPLWKCINKWEFIILLVHWYQWILISESLPIVNLTERHIRDGSEQKIWFKRVWKFWWDLSNVISGGNWLFRWDCVCSGGTLYPSGNYWLNFSSWYLQRLFLFYSKH